MQQTCTVDGCSKPRRGSKWCRMHAERMRRTGTLDLLSRSGDPVARFFKYVDRTGSCWSWTGFVDVYPRFWFEGSSKWAHRVSYYLFNGDIPTGFDVDHLCRNRTCVNPDHLEAVPPAENQARRPVITHCKHGHAYTADNTYQRPDGYRACRTCLRTTQKKHRIQR